MCLLRLCRYHATRNSPTGDDDADVAIKVYKTSILVFKDREQYISGDYRFSNGCSKGNPRKMVSAAATNAAVAAPTALCCLVSTTMILQLTITFQVKMWAEKEARNLSRMHEAGIRCPKPLQLRNHVLAMTFIGRDSKVRARMLLLSPPRSSRVIRGLIGRAASARCRRESRKVAAAVRRGAQCWHRYSGSQQHCLIASVQVVLAMHAMWNKCKLVHGDLSEYNILYLSLIYPSMIC